MNLQDLIIKHEGLVLKPYRCTAGKLTIGVGRNLEDVGITRGEAMLLLSNDIQSARSDALNAFPWYSRLNHPRQAVVISMIFNLGLAGFQAFKKMIAAIEGEEFGKAADEMLSSRWAGQVGKRATELATMMRRGAFLD